MEDNRPGIKNTIKKHLDLQHQDVTKSLEIWFHCIFEFVGHLKSLDIRHRWIFQITD